MNVIKLAHARVLPSISMKLYGCPTQLPEGTLCMHIPSNNNTVGAHVHKYTQLYHQSWDIN